VALALAQPLRVQDQERLISGTLKWKSTVEIDAAPSIQHTISVTAARWHFYEACDRLSATHSLGVGTHNSPRRASTD
jgi:hypothetical protein